MKIEILEKKGVDIPELGKHFLKGETVDIDPSIASALERTKSAKILESKKKSDS